MRQNRVDPLGVLHSVPDRGGWMGNKGCLHDGAGRIVRGWQGRRWITCWLAFRDRKRALMQPGRYTEVFFLDEATAAAAGHRPCAECRHEDWQAFRALWAACGGAAGADAVDAGLHAARLDGRARRLVPIEAGSVPCGAMVLAGGPVLRKASGWWRWSHHGYAPVSAPQGSLALLTPLPLVRLMAEGWRVQDAAPE